MIDAHKAGKGCKKIVKWFQVPISSVRNVIKKGQLTETVRNGLDRILMWTVCVFFTKGHTTQAVWTGRQIQKHRQNQVRDLSNCNLNQNYQELDTRRTMGRRWDSCVQLGLGQTEAGGHNSGSTMSTGAFATEDTGLIEENLTEVKTLARKNGGKSLKWDTSASKRR